MVLLENVRNLADKEHHWNEIQMQLKNRGFVLTETPLILSPTDFGIPQIRERVFILGIKETSLDKDCVKDFEIREEDLDLRYSSCGAKKALSILETSVSKEYCVDEERESVLLAWEEFRQKTKFSGIGAPVWLHAMGIGIANDKAFFRKVAFDDMPAWKQRFFSRNRAFYKKHQGIIDKWVKKHDMLTKSKLYQKFEWNCMDDIPSIKEGIIQVRQSGVRVKRPNAFPALVAMNNTPIIWDKHLNHFRTITPTEELKLQSFPKKFKLTGPESQQYKQLGNSVNVEIIRQLGANLLRLRKSDSHG